MRSRGLRPRSEFWPALLVGVAACSLAAGVSRALAETFFLSLSWLAAWPGVLALMVLTLALSLPAWRWLSGGRHEAPIRAAAASAPLSLPALYALHHRVDLTQAYTLVLGGVLLAVLLGVGLRARESRHLGLGLLVVVTLGVYLATLGRTVGRADTFEFQVVAYKLGIAHPTGYPLYLLLGKLFTLLPIRSIAFRLNLLSAVCAVGTAALVWATLARLVERHGVLLTLGGARYCLPLLAALALAFSPTFWSQAVEAEVYTLNSLFVALTVWILVRLIALDWQGPGAPRLLLALAFALGLGLTNHVTIVILLPVAGLALLLVRPRFLVGSWLSLWARAALLFAAGLSLYLYLPLRWPIFHDGSAMRLAEFVDWVIGGRFKGALHLDAWRSDPTRYAIVGRLVLDQWGWAGVGLAAAGLLWLLRRNWRAAAITLFIWVGYAFYALAYYVPDISVFLIPAHLTMAVWIGCGVIGVASLANRLVGASSAWLPVVEATTITLFAMVPLTLIAGSYASMDRSAPSALEDWGRRVLGLDLDGGAAILADSEKIAPLYYLQQTEGLRPDLEIMVLPDEDSYRRELDARVAAGQTVYLARFLPRLEGLYHLRSVAGAGEQLIEVGSRPMTALPGLDGCLDSRFGPHVLLLGYTVPAASPRNAPGEWEAAYPDSFHVTLYWSAEAPVGGVYQVWLRLVDAEGAVRWRSEGAHPAGNHYPTSAWRPGEIVPDAHEIALPPTLAAGEYQLQVALLVPFGSAGLLPDKQSSPWLSVGTLKIGSPRDWPASTFDTRIWVDGSVILGVDAPGRVRPGANLAVAVRVAGDEVVPVRVGWSGEPGREVHLSAPAAGLMLAAPSVSGDHSLVLWSPRTAMRCGWLRRLADSCPLARVAVEGTPLPAGAANFDDLIALLSVDVADWVVRPGDTLDVALTWQALDTLTEDYTVFVHVLDAADRIVGQVDSWPVQGTYPTSRWRPGTPISDGYSIAVAADAAPGRYRLEIGWYLLSTMRRLTVLGPDGMARDDRVLLEGVVVPE